MPNIITRARLSIDSASQGNKQLKDCKSFDETDDSDLEPAHTIESEAPVGHIDKPGGGTIELEYYQREGAPEVDFYKLQRLKEYFVLERQNVGGTRLQYGGVRVANVAGGGESGAAHMLKVKLVWSTREPL
jgi:hypothetical protein